VAEVAKEGMPGKGFTPIFCPNLVHHTANIGFLDISYKVPATKKKAGSKQISTKGGVHQDTVSHNEGAIRPVTRTCG
jgi:hypothetical protein